jgi:hypothetical protein
VSGTIYELAVQAPPGETISYDPVRLADVLGIDDPSRLAVETDGMHSALVTIYPEDPLARVHLPDPGLLVMDASGRIPTGRYHNGRLKQMRLYDPASGSAQRSLIFGTTGAGKSTATHILLAAEKRSGVVTFASDLKGGAGIPEARGNVDWYTRTQEGCMAQLRTVWDIMGARQERSAAAGRSQFLLNRPDPLISMRIEEANRLLERGAPYRGEATFYIKDIGRTGRSLGIGMHLSAQGGNLEELGGSDTLRGMLKDGDVVLLRWTSSLMRQLVTDGILPTGQRLVPIPKYAGTIRLISQFDDDEPDDRPGTQGNGYLITGPFPTARMRFWSVGSAEPTEGLDPEILALYGDGEPSHLEAASLDTAGEAYDRRLDGPEAFAAAFPEVEEEKEAKNSAPRGRSARPGTQPRPRTLADRIQAVLEEREGPIDARAVLEAVNADGGRTVRLASVRNTLSALKS